MAVKSLVITDLTRMSGDRVCIAGITVDGQTIRPEFNHDIINEGWLFDTEGKVVIRPFARIRLDLIKHCPEPPHTEDWLVDPGVKISDGLLSIDERKKLVRKVLDPSVAAIFGAEIHHKQGYFVQENEGARSLGTVKVAHLNDVSHRCFEGRWDYRISFIDCGGAEYRLGVTDLTFRSYVDHLREVRGIDCDLIGNQLKRKLQKRSVYLRIGLTRPTWAKHPHCCFLQINGVYSFPDYLEGNCFADFRLDPIKDP
jgi:hypothetical protein